MELTAHRAPGPPADLVADLVGSALAARGSISAKEAVELLAPLPDALHAARLHGDVAAPAEGEPGDVLRALGLTSPSPSPTAPYVAPEGQTGTPQADVYAIAGLLRTTITGQAPPPWTLATLPPRDGAARLGAALDHLLWDALADDPSQRPASAHALLDAAVAAVAGDARPTPAVPARPQLTGRLLLLALVAGIALLCGLAVTLLTLGADEVPAPDPVAALAPPLTPAVAATTARARDVAYAADQAKVMRALNRRRVARRARLAEARTGPGQARTATQLADSFGIAARGFGRAAPPPRARAANAEVRNALLLVESAYRQMARGARDTDRARWVRGRDAVRRREALLQRRLARLTDLGFRIA